MITHHESAGVRGSGVQLMLTGGTDDENLDDESTRKNRRSLSKSESKKSRVEIRPSITSGPAAMSFGNLEVMVDARSGEQHFGAPSLNNQVMMVEERLSDSHHSAASYEDHGSAGQNASVMDNRSRILAQQLSAHLQPATFEYPSRKLSFNKQKSDLASREGKLMDPNEATLLRMREQRNLSALSLVSRATSNASYNVKSQTGQVPQHIKGKLPVSQNYALLESV